MKRHPISPFAAYALATAFGLSCPTAVAAAQADGKTPPASQSAPADQDLINPDRPGIADGSRVIARGQLQFEMGFQREFREEAGTRTRTSFVPVLLRVGISSRLEARVETNAYTWVEATDPSGTNHTSGWSPASLGFKYQICDFNGTLRRSLGTIVRIFPASGSGDFGTQHATGDVRLAADVDLSKTLSLNPNVGVARYEGGDGRTFTATLFALTLNYLPSDHVNPFVDMGYQRPVDVGGPASLILDVGLAYIVGRNVQLDVSIGTGAHGPAPHPFIAFGVSLRSH